jgi:beta-glucanase (GH16 family)
MTLRLPLILTALLLNPAFAAPATQPSPADKPGWTLSFHDEFDGTKLDESKWIDRYWSGRTHSNHELQYYAPDGYSLAGGVLHLNARPVPQDQREKTQQMPYASGMICSYGKFSQKYGWFEIRARFPRGKGYWPAFWLLPDNRRWPPEIDVLEILGHEISTAHFTVHFRDEQRRHKDDSHQWTGPDFSADFHTFAADWQSGLIVWYVDGIERARTTQGVPDEPMYVIANLAIGGDWPGNPTADTKFPQSMDIDYIRVYQKAEKVEGGR